VAGFDLGKTAAEWDTFAGEEFAGTMLAPVRYLREAEDRFRREREQCFVRLDLAAHLDVPNGGATLIGTDPALTTSKRGEAFIRITGTGAARTVSAYTATGASGLIAQGSGADGATITLAEQNSSGASGTWQLPSSTTNTSADELVCEVILDFPKLLPKVYTQARSVDDDADSRTVLQSGYIAIANAIQAARRAFISTTIIRALLSNGQDNPIARGNAFLISAETALFSDVSGGDGENVTRVLGGLIQRFSDSMLGETTGGEQFVLKTIPAAAAGVFDGSNDGSGTVASHTPGQATPASRWRFKCSNGADDGNLGKETFDVEITFTKPGDERVLTERGLQVGKLWSGPLGFGPITLVRTLTKTGDGTNVDFAVASGATVTGETNANTASGDIHGKVVTNGSNWDFEFYKTSALLTADLVAKATNIATGAAFTAVAQNSSGLKIVWTAGSAPTNGNTAVLNLNVFNRSNSANSKPDEFTVTVTTSGVQGLIQTMIAEEIGGSLNSTTSSSETIEDDYAKANTFPDFAVQDN